MSERRKKPPTPEEIRQTEEEYSIVDNLHKRSESLRKKQPVHLQNYRSIMEAYDELERQYDLHIKEEEAFLKQLPERITARIKHDKDVLEMRKQILELVKGK